MASVVLRTECGITRTCPEIALTEGGDVKITGYREGSPQTPENEQTIVAPGRLFPELVALDIPDFEGWLEQRLGSPGDMLRIQTLQRYGAEDPLVEAYHRSERAPLEDFSEWGAILDAHHLADQAYRNLHVIDGELSREMQMQFGWAYTYNTDHHMQVRVLDVAHHPEASVLLRLGDFWVVQHDHVALCHYDQDGQPTGMVQVEPAGAAGYQAAAEMAWALGEDFTSWWAAHPEYHRAARRAA